MRSVDPQADPSSPAGPSAHGFLLNRQQWRIEALSASILRLRVRRGRGTFSAASWAVVPSQGAPTPLTARATRRQFFFATSELTMTVDRVSGAWCLRDGHDLALFESLPDGFEFKRRGARCVLKLAERERVFGLATTSGTLDRRGSRRDFRNTDVLGRASSIHPQIESLYVSIPVALSMREGRAAGLFWDQPGRQRWDVGHADPVRWEMDCEEGDVDLYLLGGPTPERVLSQFTALTGRTPLPPRWALGYQQSRYSYRTGAELERVAAEFRRRKLPCDVLYCDIDHLDGHRVFTFGKGYPDPAAMLRRLGKRGFKVVFIVNPGVKDEPRFPVLRRGRKSDSFVKAPSGRADFLGEVWPGRVRFPDFFHPATGAWWAQEQSVLLRLGAAGIWNDMNEPANFAGPDKEMDPECLHRTRFGVRRHAEVRNAYGSEMARVTREGWLSAQLVSPASRKRPFVLSRAGYAGIQRYAAVWTGDNASTWEHLADSIPMLLNLGLSGVPFVGADLGGFIGNPTPELFIRWLQLGVFTPFLRNHSNTGTPAQEPWAFGPEVEAIARQFLGLRYQLIPYLYATFAESARTGAPVMRPMLWHHPNDPLSVGCQDQFLVGAHLMVAPITQPGVRARSVYLPKGEWYDFWKGTLIVGGVHTLAEAPLERIPLFVRAGSILPFAPAVEHLTGASPTALYLHVWPGHGAFHWYDDDGESEAYREGRCTEREMAAYSVDGVGQLVIGESRGEFQSRQTTWRVVLRSLDRAVKVKVGNRAVPSEFVPELGIQSFEMPCVPGVVTARWR